MKCRTGFLSQNGFSFAGTLISVVVGASLAILLATAVNTYLKNRRVVRERSELSEFYRSVKSLLTVDSSCQALFQGLSFSPIGEHPLELKAGFGENPKGPLKVGFRFNKGTMSIAEFMLMDKGIPPISFELQGQSVTRYMARVKLQVTANDGTLFQARFFEFPVLIDRSTHIIKTCNNEFNIGDACEALGFRWDPSTSRCVPATACLSGGAYTVSPGGLFNEAGCKIANPATLSCRCPAGYTDLPAGTVDLNAHCGRYCFSTYNTVHQCLRCPQQ